MTQRKQPPDPPPSLSAVLLMVSSLGGFLKRTGDKFPGPTALWIGLQRLRDFTLAAQALNKTYG